ncbi:dTMP kinase [soil metagenome]
MLNNRFITFEGIEGVGKSTCVKYLYDYLKQANLPVIATREPGGTAIGEDIRKVLLAHHSEEMSNDTELLLMFAARSQHITTIIEPALRAGSWVLCDRFTDATYAYQGGGRGIDEKRIALLETWVQEQLRPALTFLLDANVDLALSRAKRRGAADRIEIEKRHFFEKIRYKYLERAKNEPERFHIIDASQPRWRVLRQLRKAIDTKVDASSTVSLE